METPLTPLEFMRRTRRLYANREAVVDGASRWTYEEFFDRCDRWSSALQALGVAKGDRVAYIAPNTHAQLESFYAVPQIGAVLVPINFRLVGDDFKYLIQHSGSTVVCVDTEYIDKVDAIRAELTGVRHFVALGGSRDGWLDLRPADGGCERAGRAAGDRGARSPDDQLHQRHDVAAQGRDDYASQRLGERRRHAPARADDLRRSVPVDAADVSRERLDVHLDCHRGRRHPRVPAQGRCRRRSSAWCATSGSR